MLFWSDELWILEGDTTKTLSDGRPPKTRARPTIFQLKLPRPIAAAVREDAALWGVSPNEVMRRAIAAYLVADHKEQETVAA
jgi:hypothetical protein